MKKLRRSSSALALRCSLGGALCSGLLVVACEGTETDNPVAGGAVFDGTSPDNLFPPPQGTPPCVPTTLEEQPMAPRRIAQSVLVPSAAGVVIATGTYAGGLSLIDASDPESPVELSRGVVRGEIHQLLLASSGELWVLATEPPDLGRAELPALAGLDPVLRLVRVDVSDPARPVRVADASLEGEGWQLRERDGEAWVLSARPDQSQRGCAAQENGCGFRSYEALLIQGFRASGAALEPIGVAELPFEQRAWWGGDGLVTLAAGTLSVAGWDGAGALLEPRQLPDAGSDALAGPVEIVGDELSVVHVAQGQARVDVYDLAANGAELARSLSLGARTERPGIASLFAADHLWLQAPDQQGSAELWRLAGAAAARVELPHDFHTLLPIAGAAREGQPGEILAIGAARGSSGTDELRLLSIQAGVASVIEAPELDAPYLDLSDPIPAPAGVRGPGDAPGWVLVAQGPGLPLAIQPALPTTQRSSITTTFVGVAASERAPGASVAPDAVTGVALVEAFEPGRGAFTALDFIEPAAFPGAAPGQRIELPALMRALAPTARGVLTVASAPASECEQSGVDCSGYAPGVSVFELAGGPRLVASLPLPEPPLPPVDDPNHVSVRWDLYDPLTGEQPAALALGQGQLAFVASVELSCDDPEECEALGLAAVPIGEANVAFGVPAACPPVELDPGCDTSPPPTPSVYGDGQRRYFFVLDLDAEGGPAWEAWGVSRLAATAARTDRESRFATPFATDGVLAVTRLERRRSSSDPNDRGAIRFFLDRFERSTSAAAPEADEIAALPPVNIPGYAVARVGTSGALERWLSVEAADTVGAARLHRMNLQSDGARIEQTLELGGAFAGFRVLSAGEHRLGLVLTTPSDGCGTSELSAIAVGSNPADPGEPLAIASTLELPASGWAIAATDGDLALLRRGGVYVLVRVAADGTLAVVSTRSIDVALGNEQLLGTGLFGAAGQFGPRWLELLP